MQLPLAIHNPEVNEIKSIRAHRFQRLLNTGAGFSMRKACDGRDYICLTRNSDTVDRDAGHDFESRVCWLCQRKFHRAELRHFLNESGAVKLSGTEICEDGPLTKAVITCRPVVGRLLLPGEVDLASRRVPSDPFLAVTDSMDWAAKNGDVAVLEQWRRSGHPLVWTDKAMDWASHQGHLNVLGWFLESGLQCKYSENAVDWASDAGHVHVLDWWKSSGLMFKWSCRAVTSAKEAGRMDVLRWFLKYGPELPYWDMHPELAFVLNQKSS
jgi:hypothetical protein